MNERFYLGCLEIHDCTQEQTARQTVEIRVQQTPLVRSQVRFQLTIRVAYRLNLVLTKWRAQETIVFWITSHRVNVNDITRIQQVGNTQVNVQSEVVANIEVLEGRGRVEELARLLGGDSGNSELQAHAASLLSEVGS